AYAATETLPSPRPDLMLNSPPPHPHINTVRVRSRRIYHIREQRTAWCVAARLAAEDRDLDRPAVLAQFFDAPTPTCSRSRNTLARKSSGFGPLIGSISLRARTRYLSVRVGTYVCGSLFPMISRGATHEPRIPIHDRPP